MELENVSLNFDLVPFDCSFTKSSYREMKPSRLGVVTFKSTKASPSGEVYTCRINADHTLTRIDNAVTYYAVSSFVADVESELWSRREENYFDNMKRKKSTQEFIVEKQSSECPNSIEIPRTPSPLEESINTSPIRSQPIPRRMRVPRQLDAKKRSLDQPKTPILGPSHSRKRLSGISLFGFSF